MTALVRKELSVLTFSLKLIVMGARTVSRLGASSLCSELCA